MPDSLRELLQRLAAEGGTPPQDLTAGAMKKARVIGRRRMAAGALGAVAGLALTGIAAAALITPGDDSPPPPTNRETTEAPTNSPTDDENEAEGDCGRPSTDWTGWGDSASTMELTELPEALYLELTWSDGTLTQVHRYAGGDSEYVLEGESMGFSVAPDGNRYATTPMCGMAIATIGENAAAITGLGIDSLFCSPTWAPDSNSVAITVPSPEYDEGYLLDLATGEQTDLPEEVSCSPRWSAGGEYLVNGEGTVAMRTDGSDRTELAGASTWTSDETFSGLSAISADLGRACLQFDDAELASSGHIDPWRCDRLVDTASGDAIGLPVDTQENQVVFLADGGMIVSGRSGEDITVSLMDADMSLLDSRTLDAQDASTTRLMGYYTG
ncbi:hypothetical protein [Glycomyces buryatensis]|uniref:Uncharacterized protein n=1 Tax=Glycomyces buryatensis TaxID=2570927 RepID=A0A4S8Q3I0_9ACTN|nr:hypothetical protein [Glycomyces buryatensis]THV38570.1 hypothetical protein FAB82_19215 [Glycomyces buryatensis]